MKETPGFRYEVPNPEITELLRNLGAHLGAQLPQGWGFTLFLVEFGENGATFYISNTNRKDMIAAMEQFIAKAKEDFTG
jgi:hypothetical protein